MNDAHRFFNFEEEKVTDILLQQFQDLCHAKHDCAQSTAFDKLSSHPWSGEFFCW